MKNKVEEAVKFIKDQIKISPELGMILGSGLGGLADMIKNPIDISFKDVPNFPISTVPGHAGKLVFGELEGVPVSVMRGRVHYYEGYNLKQVTFPVYVLRQLGAKSIILTNAAGGINQEFKAGDLMLIRDHINLLGNNPLIGSEEMGHRFIDMTHAYSPELIELAKGVAKSLELPLKEGVYACMTGPSYETPAEIKMLKIIGADAVGMSTVPEVIASRQCEMKVLAISCITNMASGITYHKISHEEVMEGARKGEKMLEKLIKGIVKEMSR